MRLTIFGATGGTGLELLRQGTAAGHTVTAVVRDPHRVPAELREHLTVVQADLLDDEAIAPAVKDADGVLTAMGSRSALKPTTVCADSVHAIVRAMDGAGRLLMVSAAGLHSDAGDGPITRYVLKPLIIQRVFRNPYTDLREAERVLRASTVDWTIVRPSRLTNGPRTSHPRTAIDLNVRGGAKTTRADLAACMLDLVADPSCVRRVVSIAS